MRDIVIRSKAKQEILAAYRWYEEKRPGLGDEFLLCMDATIEKIRRTPELYSIVHRNVRRALTKRFPYGVFFVVQENQVTVLAVFHGHRDPRIVHRRH